MADQSIVQELELNTVQEGKAREDALEHMEAVWKMAKQIQT